MLKMREFIWTQDRNSNRYFYIVSMDFPWLHLIYFMEEIWVNKFSTKLKETTIDQMVEQKLDNWQSLVQSS